MVSFLHNPCLISRGRLVKSVRVQSLLWRFNSVMRVLCVAEKPSIAKAVANHLSGGEVQTVRAPSCSFDGPNLVYAYVHNI